jgi:hypothetical protein
MATSAMAPSAVTMTPAPVRSDLSNAEINSRASAISRSDGVKTSLMIGSCAGWMAVRARKPSRNSAPVLLRSAVRSRKCGDIGATGGPIRCAAEAMTSCSRSGVSSAPSGPGRSPSSAIRSASPMPSRATRGAAATAATDCRPAAVSISGSTATLHAATPSARSRAASRVSTSASSAGSAFGTTTPVT